MHKLVMRDVLRKSKWEKIQGYKVVKDGSSRF